MVDTKTKKPKRFQRCLKNWKNEIPPTDVDEHSYTVWLSIYPQGKPERSSIIPARIFWDQTECNYVFQPVCFAVSSPDLIHSNTTCHLLTLKTDLQLYPGQIAALKKLLKSKFYIEVMRGIVEKSSWPTMAAND